MSGGGKCTWPMEHLRDNNFTKYSLQLNMYRSILMRCYGLNITQIILIVVHPNQDSFQQIACPIMDAEINTLLDYRKLQLIKGGHRPITADVTEVMGDLTNGSWMCIEK